MMRAMLLAAGRGERMGDLTQDRPKPLLQVGGRYLIEFAIFQLLKAGIREIVINVSYCHEQIIAALGDGGRYGVDIVYSEEAERLETGGGIFRALSLLGDRPFLVMSTDIITDFPLLQLPKEPVGLAHLVLVKGPCFHLKGDFGLCNGRIDLGPRPLHTFANIGVYRPELFHNCQEGRVRLRSILVPAIQKRQVTGELFQGMWYNIGTPEDLRAINFRAREDSNLRPLASETNTLSN